MWIRRTLPILTLLPFLALSVVPATAQDGLLVKEIVFEGNTTRRPSSLKQLIKTKEGETFSDSKLQDDVSTLRAFFDQVTARTEPVAGGLRVTFTVVEENPVLTSVVFRGITAVPLTTVKEDIWTKQGYPFAEFKVERDVARIEDLLKDKGHYFAEVKAAVGDYAGGKQVLFTAIEGPKVQVEEIRFVGNHAFDADRLTDRDVMLTKESGFLTDGTFVKRTLDQDLVSIANFYRREGYLDVVVDLRELSFSPDKEEVTITIGISEGKPYVIRSIDIEGAKSFPADRGELTKLLKIEVGQVRRQEDLYLTRRALRNFYLENAYYDADVQVEPDDDSRDHSTKITIHIDEGATASIRRIEIEGNSITREDVIRRYINVHPGGPLNSIEIEKSKSRLEQTQFFELPGGVTSRVRDTDVKGVKDVVFRVKEGRTGSIKFSAGVTSDLGLLGLVQITKRNFDISDTPSRFGDIFTGRAFTGGGQSLDLSVSPGTALSQYQLSFGEPWFWDQYVFYGPSGEVEESPFSLALDLHLRDFTAYHYDEKRTGFSVGTGKYWRKPGRIFDDVFRAKVSFRLENVRLSSLEDNAPPNAFELEGLSQVRYVDFDLGWNHVDLPASPGRGFESDLSFELAGGPVGGEVDFGKIQGGITQFFTLYTTREDQRHILTLSGRLGWAKAFGSSDSVPLFDRYFLGGQSTVRGFDYGDVGPRAEGNPFTPEGRDRIAQSMADGNGDPLGGETMWTVKAEYGFPLYADVLRGVVFMDSGNASEGHFDHYLFHNWRAAVGFGFRIHIPFLGPRPIALDFGWPIRKEKGDTTQVLSFSIDRPFN